MRAYFAEYVWEYGDFADDLNRSKSFVDFGHKLSWPGNSAADSGLERHAQ